MLPLMENRIRFTTTYEPIMPLTIDEAKPAYERCQKEGDLPPGLG